MMMKKKKIEKRSKVFFEEAALQRERERESGRESGRVREKGVEKRNK